MKQKGISRRKTLDLMAKGTALAAAGTSMPGALLAAKKPIKMGFLSGLTGLETILGETQLNCFKLAVSEINRENGIAGRPIKIIVEDDQTTTRGAIEKSRKLINRDKVDVIIGLIASLTHVAARSVTTPAKKLLMYTTYYEGEVCEDYFFSTGQIPNQQIAPSLIWIANKVGKSTYIVGSDYIWPRKSTEMIKQEMRVRGGEVLGAEFVPFGTQDYAPILSRILKAKPDFVWVMLAGDDMFGFLKQYKSFAVPYQVFSHGLDDVFSGQHPDLCTGILSNQSYFMRVNTPENRRFKKAYADMFGAKKPINAIGEAAYNAVYMYKLAVEKAGSTDADKVRKALHEVEFNAPQGTISFAKNNVLRSNSILARCNQYGYWNTVLNFGQFEPIVPGCSI